MNKVGAVVKAVVGGVIQVVGPVLAVNGSWIQVADPRGGSDEWPAEHVFVALPGDVRAFRAVVDEAHHQALAA